MTAAPRLHYRALAVLASFAAALAAFLLLRAAEPPSSRGEARAVAPALSRPGGSTDAEIARLQAIVRGAPRETAPRVQLATAYLAKARETGDPAFYVRADGLLRAALARAPGDPDALVASAGLALSRHEFQRGLALARRARAARPAALAAYPALVDALVELGRFGAAERTLQRLVDAKPGLAGYARVSYFRELHGDLEGAAAAMRRAIAAGGPARQSVASVQSLLGTLELARGRVAAAESAHRAALTGLPGYPTAEAGLARAAAARGDLAGAIRRWRALAERLPLPEYVIGLGEAQLAAGRIAAGRRELELVGAERRLAAGAASAPDTSAPDTSAADAPTADGSSSASSSTGGVRLDAELAVFEADHGSAARALALARRAWVAAPGLRAADARGWALTRSGRPAAGLRWAHRALRLGSRDAIFRYHAGMAALAAGRDAEGRSHLRVALDHGLAGWQWQAAQAREALMEGGPR
jgi:tetratricopeptide (TPR) repeat protein